MTEATYRPGLLTWLIAGGVCLVGCWLGCCLIPFCIDGVQDVEHRFVCCFTFVLFWFWFGSVIFLFGACKLFFFWWFCGGEGIAQMLVCNYLCALDALPVIILLASTSAFLEGNN